jgi:uncharacterized protein YndB with AHSA1/START domain
MTTDRIEKQIFLRAKQSRVWQALTDSQQFGSWFGVKFEGPFLAGSKIHGILGPSTVEFEERGPHHGKAIEMTMERIEPERLFSFRWHPHAIDSATDYSGEPMTLVTFALQPKDGGILLVLTESGFDGIPFVRRAEALKSNEGGWAIQLERIERYLAHAS